MFYGQKGVTMAHTPEQRSAQPLCGALKRDGTTCRAFAGQGTDHIGLGACKWHGGSTIQHRQKALKEIARRNMAQYGREMEIEPVEARPHPAPLGTCMRSCEPLARTAYG